MSALTMVIETVDTNTGATIRADYTDRHGWASPAEAVKHWRAQGPINAYLNGRVIRTPEIAVETRVYFRSEPEALFDVAEVLA